jgi:hypothetical protein
VQPLGTEGRTQVRCAGRGRKRAWPHAALTVLVPVADEQRRGRPTPPHAFEVGGRLSKLQGHEDVQGRRGERRGPVPPGQHAPCYKGEVRSAGWHRLAGRPLVGRRQSFLWSALRRQVFVVVISKRSRRQGEGDGPSVVGLGRHQEEDQKVGEPPHLRARLPVQRTPAQPHNLISRVRPRQPGRVASRRRWIATMPGGTVGRTHLSGPISKERPVHIPPGMNPADTDRGGRAERTRITADMRGEGAVARVGGSPPVFDLDHPGAEQVGARLQAVAAEAPQGRVPGV